MRPVWRGLVVVAMLAPVGAIHAFDRDSVVATTSRVWITGASNIRRFSCRANEISGTLDLHARATRERSFGGDNRSDAPSLRVMVNAVDCGIGAMSRHLRETLNSDRFSAIEFHLTTYEVDLTARTAIARLIGSVSIHGVRRPVETMAVVRAGSSGEVHVIGDYVIRMSDFGVVPPRRFGGLLRVKDRITVHFDVSPARSELGDELWCALCSPSDSSSGATYAHCP
jgi:hypothetical protein